VEAHVSALRICLVGFGEVGQILAADLLARGSRNVSAWDIQFPNAASGPSRASVSAGVHAGVDAHDAVAGAELVISAVTAAQDIEAARSTAPHLSRSAFFLDLNSVSPEVKKEVGRLIETRGARYVEAAIMAPISPRRIAAPMLLGGPHAAAFLPLARELGFDGAEVFSAELGRASAVKMCRSIVVKGMEALLTESLLTARRYGVEENVLDSLQNLFPVDDWRARARYMISRSLIHGRRRAEEMREVARTVAEAGFDPWMSSACAERQDWAAGYREADAHESLDTMLDAVLAMHAEGSGR
jgi:3-hydroxyisobutyrate dehydrogenase-like beta-hydroxyacid dehydrogenase